ncbi:uncharacterized protein At4g15970-like [Selaginella moellendorffii]|uniref:uncharacterized protein At4g15970-like n=1 Tax=Selaginella moellendorffii TaxID=88036 RepID=UPI000D1C37FC|nr:uncharacterized protein At4g15970-like [Selaginella moellendorffii]|eukprot:XP_024523308.1 uncharacterized protein At4g15970-like [Selaginella moellendorffii]
MAQHWLDRQEEERVSAEYLGGEKFCFGQAAMPQLQNESQLHNLHLVLRNAAFLDRTVVITAVNCAWANPGGMLDVFLEAFHHGSGTESLLEHLVIVSVDNASHKRCMEIHKHCFELETSGLDFSSEKKFMSLDYQNMMWRRIFFLGTVLELGYSFVFTDTDVIWLRSPFKHFDSYADIEIAVEKFPKHPKSVNNGYIYVRSNNRTIEFYKLWYKLRNSFLGKHEQDILNMMLHSTYSMHPEFWKLGLKTRFLNSTLFSSFCNQASRSLDLNQACTVHANCCSDLKKKIRDLKLVVDDWKTFQANTGGNEQGSMKLRAPRECLHYQV